MKKIAKGENLDNVSEKDLKENVVSIPKTKRYLVLTDDDGNIKGYFPLKEKNLGKDWLALYQNPSLWLGQQKMTGEQYSVLFALFNKLDFNNFLRVTRQELADALNIQPSHISRAMKVLKEKNIIVEGPPAGKFKTYRLNPYIGHKGKNRKETILDFEEELAKQGKNITEAEF